MSTLAPSYLLIRPGIGMAGLFGKRPVWGVFKKYCECLR